MKSLIPTIRECYEKLKAELERMPAFKVGTRWHGDRVRELVRIEASLSPIAGEAELTVARD